MFADGTGIAHCLIANTDNEVRLLTVGESIAGDRVADPGRRRPDDNWTDVPQRPLGPHDGRADRPARGD